MDHIELVHGKFRIILMDGDCPCKETDIYPDGNSPVWLKDVDDLLILWTVEYRRLMSLVQQKKFDEASFRYYSWHLDGRHVLKIST